MSVPTKIPGDRRDQSRLHFRVQEFYSQALELSISVRTAGRDGGGSIDDSARPEREDMPLRVLLGGSG